jgi:hypothetical protein
MGERVGCWHEPAGFRESMAGCNLLVVGFLLPEVTPKYAYVCRNRYWVELLPVEDCYGSDAPIEDFT